MSFRDCRVRALRFTKTNMGQFLFDIDYGRYLRFPVADVQGSLALGISMISAHDRSLPPVVRREARRLRQALVDLQQVWGAVRSTQAGRIQDPRESDARVDRAWAAVFASIQGAAGLPDDVPQSQAARQLLEAVFPTGLRFLLLPFEKQWSESEIRLDQLRTPDLGRALSEVVASYVVDELMAAHEEYGRVLGITDAKQLPPAKVGLMDVLRQFREALHGYVFQLLAAGHADPKLQPAVRASLRPLDTYRETLNRRAVARARASGDEDVLEGEGEGTTDEGGSADVEPAPTPPPTEDAATHGQNGSPVPPPLNPDTMTPTTPVPELAGGADDAEL